MTHFNPLKPTHGQNLNFKNTTCGRPSCWKVEKLLYLSNGLSYRHELLYDDAH